jgi:hypothetical protein
MEGDVAPMTSDRVILYDRAGNPLGDLASSSIYEMTIVEEINGEHSLTIETSTVMQVGTYALTKGYDGRWREWCVNEPDELHESGATAVGTYTLPWSLYTDLMAADGSELWASAEDGTLDPITARQALTIALSDQVRWGVGTVDVDTTGAVSLYDDQVWNYLSKLVGVFGGEVDAEIEVDASGVVSRNVALRRHLGSETVMRRFDWGRDLTSIRRTPAEGPYFCGVRPRGGQTKTDNDGVDYTDRVGIEDEPARADEGDGWYHDAGSPYLVATDARDVFRISDGHGGWLYPMRVMTYDVAQTSFGPDAEELLDKAAADVYDVTHPKTTYEATVLAFANAGMDVVGLALGDEVHVADLGFNPDAALRVEGRVYRVEYDPRDIAATMDLTIGQLQETLAETIRGLTKGTLASVERRIAVVEGEAARFAAVDATVLVADMARIEALDVDQIAADHAKIGSIDTNQLAADHAVIETLDANYAHITNGAIDNATIGHASVDGLDANYAQINLANVTNTWIENGVLRNGSIADAKIIGVSANKLTAGTIDAATITVLNLNASNITVGTLNGQRIGEGTVDLTKLAENVYTEEEVNDLLAAMDARIDSQIQTYTGDVVPLLNNYPASDWTTDALRDEHIGDLYYVVNAGSQANGYSYRFVYDRTTGQYSWVLIQDSAVTDALQRLIDVEGDITGLKDFQSDTATWASQTDGALSIIRQNHTALTTVVGRTLDSTVQLWRATPTTTAPTLPNVPVVNTGDVLVDHLGNAFVTDTGDVLVTDGRDTEWTTAIPQYDPDRPHYWYCMQYAYADGTYSWGDPVYDRVTSDAQATAQANVQDSVQLWIATATDAVPALPTAPVTVAADVRGQWTTAVPTWDEGYPHYWYCVQYKLGDGSYRWGDATYDRATTTSQRNAALALEGLETKVEVETFNELSSTVDQNSATITQLTSVVQTKADGSTVSTLSNTVNQVKQTADTNTASISRLTQTVSDNESDIESKYSRVTQDLNGVTSTVGTISQTVNDHGSRLSTAESQIQQLDGSISLMATKTEVEGAQATAEAALERSGGIRYESSYTYDTDSDTYVFTAALLDGDLDITEDADPLRFVWYLHNEDEGVVLLGRGKTMTVTGSRAGYNGSVIGGYDDAGSSFDAVLTDHLGNALVTSDGDSLVALIIWED